jgi:PAS domain S-box-containing protein
MLPRQAVWVWQLTLLTLVYFVAGKLGLLLAFVHASATAVWPPTGIALTAFLLLGSRVWPAILLGAFLVNVTTAGSVLTSIGIATGNTFEGLLGASLVARFANGRRVFDRARDIFKLVLLAGLFSTTLSATIGVTSLALGGYARWTDYRAIWFTWWMGGAAGVLVFAPVLLLWSVDRTLRWSRGRAIEAALLLLGVLLAGVVVFDGLSPLAAARIPAAFLCMPILVWAAFRFGQRETSTCLLLLSAFAVRGTLHGFGPFALQTQHDSLLLLQAFLVTVAMTTIPLAAVVAQLKRSDEVHARLAAIVESSNDAVIGKTLEGVITSWNAGAERLYGYTALEAIGQSISIITPPELPNELPQIFDRLRRGRRIETHETVRMKKDGTRVRVSLTVSPVLDSTRAVIGASAIAQDMTEQKRMEEALRNAEALRAVASVATAAAHEINNPLTVALGEAHLLSKESDAKHGRLQHLIEALERIRDVVRTMQQITRLERAESLKNVPEMLDLRKSSSDAVDQGEP